MLFIYSNEVVIYPYCENGIFQSFGGLNNNNNKPSAFFFSSDKFTGSPVITYSFTV